MSNARATELSDQDSAAVEPEPGSRRSPPAVRPPAITDEDPDVGLSQKGLDEDAVIRRETDI
ncbi:hypothetical protein ACLBX9_26845 [Methylobacterium sp. A49B]|uniref:Uncharacterized protein n=1 Tax=Methylobacterium mesophilicum SR1.6/6 TaxID=908290 RepID=A0A6B9FR02_9HYPH|nr:hypothetical protein [Methylobacterium mesophilicum]QGY05041.1 hypothetical protein MMSR116_26440 [Methylobacterium mesophilicum SR1.6/6]